MDNEAHNGGIEVYDVSSTIHDLGFEITNFIKHPQGIVILSDGNTLITANAKGGITILNITETPST